MGNSLRDQLMGLGYKPAPKAEAPVERKPGPRERPGQGRPAGASERTGQGKPTGARPGQGKQAGANERPGQDKSGARERPGQRKPGLRPASPGSQDGRKPARTREEMDLGKAYALRAQKEKDDRIEAERIKQEEAKLRREAKARLAELLKDRSLNDPAAEIARHFPYGGKIKRIHVTPDQLKALNAGELGVAQMDGRYLLLPIALLLEAEAIFPPAVALKVDPDASPGDDPYSDPAYQVPDDLIW